MNTQEIKLRYGCNPHQVPARIFSTSGSLPLTVLNGAPGYINMLDALNSWQLVRELREAVGLPAAASFKHVSPAGAAVAVPLTPTLTQSYGVEGLTLSPLATAYARARGADRVSSFGDWVAVSDVVDVSTARLLRREVSDGIIAPGYDDEALKLLQTKHNGRFCIIQMDPNYRAPEMETREVFGITFEQRRNDLIPTADKLGESITANTKVPDSARRDMLVSLIALKYTQSNSVCLTLDGQVIGAGAGQQSRILCTRLASSKADNWWLRQHPAVLGLPFAPETRRPDKDNAIDGFLRDDLTAAEEADWRTKFTSVPVRLTHEEKRRWLDTLTGVTLGSDAFIPFRDNIDRASQSGVTYVVQPGGSIRDEDIVAACDDYGMAMVLDGMRLFHH